MIYWFLGYVYNPLVLLDWDNQHVILFKRALAWSEHFVSIMLS